MFCSKMTFLTDLLLLQELWRKSFCCNTDEESISFHKTMQSGKSLNNEFVDHFEVSQMYMEGDASISKFIQHIIGESEEK